VFEDLAKQIEENRRRNIIMKKEQELLDELYEKKYQQQLNQIKKTSREPSAEYRKVIQTDYTKTLCLTVVMQSIIWDLHTFISLEYKPWRVIIDVVLSKE